MDRYPPIAEHGLIGDLQTAALVTTDGTVDWWCTPRFDSPSVFGSLLDHDNGGRCRIGPEGDDYVARQLYFPDTAVLITRFMTADGVGEVIDFLPVDHPKQATDRHRLVRLVRCVRGEMRFVAECAPRFDYGRQPHELELTDQGAVFRTPTLALTVHGAGQRALERDGNDLRGAITVRAGQAGGVVLESAAPGPPRTTDPEELLGLFTETARFWRGWLGRSTYRGRWREQVGRSAITLKLIAWVEPAVASSPMVQSFVEMTGDRMIDRWDRPQALPGGTLTIGYTIVTTGEDIRVAKDDPAVTSKVGWLPPPAVGEMAYFTVALMRPNRQHIELRHALPVAAVAMKSGEAVLITATRRPIRSEEKEQLRVARQRLALARPEIMANMPDSAEPRALMHGQNDSGGRYVFDLAL